jgi:ribonuclease H
MKKLFIGVDEAGRGCCLGALTMAAVLVSNNKLEQLRTTGVNDSKKVSAKKRAAICNWILTYQNQYMQVAQTETSASDIDRERRRGRSLNKIEMDMLLKLLGIMAKKVYALLNEGKQVVCETVIDAHTAYVEQDLSKLCMQMPESEFRLLNPRFEVKADANHVAVGAASIVAKVQRDFALKQILETAGMDEANLGISGYPDKRTLAFVENRLRRGVKMPYLRETWAPVVAIKKKIAEENARGK